MSNLSLYVKRPGTFSLTFHRNISSVKPSLIYAGGRCAREQNSPGQTILDHLNKPVCCQTGPS